jgi:hypothetical protein
MRLAYYVIAISAITPLVLSASSAMAPKDASYYCTVEFAGGLTFNQTLKKWESAKFRPERKFVLKLKYLTTRTQNDYLGTNETVTDFNITLTAAGSNSSELCLKTGDEWSETVPISQNDFITCTAGLSEDYFNLKSNRFLTSYMLGYIDGKDNDENTPVVSGGTCTRIE